MESASKTNKQQQQQNRFKTRGTFGPRGPGLRAKDAGDESGLEETEIKVFGLHAKIPWAEENTLSPHWHMLLHDGKFLGIKKKKNLLEAEKYVHCS